MFDVVDHSPRNSNPARLSQLFEPRGDINAVAVPIFAFHNYVTEIDADPQVDAAILCEARVALGHSFLQDNGTPDCVDDTSELGQQTIAH